MTKNSKYLQWALKWVNNNLCDEIYSKIPEKQASKNKYFHSCFGGERPTMKQLTWIQKHKMETLLKISKGQAPAPLKWDPFDTIEDLKLKKGQKIDFQ